jgi:Fuc2NAc and GlcNAc transferase
VIVVLALSATRDNPVTLWIWLILGGAFFVDATVTLLRRLMRRERVYEAHRSHAYQRLALRWGSHRKVTLAMLGVNIVWLLPWAVLTAKYPSYALITLVAALAPLAFLVASLGARYQEHSPRGQ